MLENFLNYPFLLVLTCSPHLVIIRRRKICASSVNVISFSFSSFLVVEEKNKKTKKKWEKEKKKRRKIKGEKARAQ